MHELRTLNLPPHRGRDFFATVFVEPDPESRASFSVETDAEAWGITIHFQPDTPYEPHVEVARIDSAHGEPHFDRLYELDQPKEWLGPDYSFEDAREDLFSNWRAYTDEDLRNHYTDEI
jgi:hypothetical protein